MGCPERNGCASALDCPDEWPVLWTGSHGQDRTGKDRMVSYRQKCQTRVYFISLFAVHRTYHNGLEFTAGRVSFDIRNTNNLRYADDTIVRAESGNNLK